MRKVRKRIQYKNLFSLFILIHHHPFLFIPFAIFLKANTITCNQIHIFQSHMDSLQLPSKKTVCLIIKDIPLIMSISHFQAKWEILILIISIKDNLWVTICQMLHHLKDKILKCIQEMCFIINIMNIITTLCLCTKEIWASLQQTLKKVFLAIMAFLITVLIIYQLIMLDRINIIYLINLTMDI